MKINYIVYEQEIARDLVRGEDILDIVIRLNDRRVTIADTIPPKAKKTLIDLYVKESKRQFRESLLVECSEKELREELNRRTIS